MNETTRMQTIALQPATGRAWRIPPTPRLPRHHRVLAQEKKAPLPAAPNLAGAVQALRQKTGELILRTIEISARQDAATLDQVITEAEALNTAAAWLASQAYPSGTQADHPLFT